MAGMTIRIGHGQGQKRVQGSAEGKRKSRWRHVTGRMDGTQQDKRRAEREAIQSDGIGERTARQSEWQSRGTVEATSQGREAASQNGTAVIVLRYPLGCRCVKISLGLGVTSKT